MINNFATIFLAFNHQTEAAQASHCSAFTFAFVCFAYKIIKKTFIALYVCMKIQITLFLAVFFFSFEKEITKGDKISEATVAQACIQEA